MMLLLRPWKLGFALACAVIVSLPFISTAHSRKDAFFFEITLSSSEPGIAQLFRNTGRGFVQEESGDQWVSGSGSPTAVRFSLPPGVYVGLRLDPSNREAVMTLSAAQIIDAAGKVIRFFPPGKFLPGSQIASAVPSGDSLQVRMVPGANDASFVIPFDEPLPLQVAAGFWRQDAVKAFALAFLAFLTLATVPWGKLLPARTQQITPWARTHPCRAILIVAIASVAVQSHPVIFFGKSFVSPNNAVYLLYDTFPTVPGYTSVDQEDAKGADVGAMMWSHLFFPVVTREAIFKHGELPLWNRYNLSGVPLLGQGQSMVGDPLNLLTLAANGATWSWDVRFLAMRVLFAFGTGLATWLLSRHLGAALLVAGTITFIGFFAFRLNHPAILSMGWSPWVLVAWCWLLDAATRRARQLAILALVGAHLFLMASGTIKEAYMMAACLDVAGVLLILLCARSGSARWSKLGWATTGGIVFVLLAAPQWLTFLDALAKSRTNYDTPAASQQPPWQFMGFFEDLFYRQGRPDEAHFLPSTNLVVLFGLLWVLACPREIFSNRRLLALLLASAVPFSLVFGIVPGSWIVKVPFLANIIHIDNTFSCALVVLSAVLAGFGLAAAIRGFGKPGWLMRYTTFVALLGVAAGVYFGWGSNASRSPFFSGYIAAMAIVLVGGPLAAWFVAGRGSRLGTGLFVGVSLGLVLCRHAQYVSTPFDPYVLNPKQRVDLSIPSPAVEFVKSQRPEPSRTIGLGYNLFPGYNQRLGLESIYGVDALRNRYIDELAGLVPLKKITDWSSGPMEAEEPRKSLPMQDLMNVRYYLATHHSTPRELAGRHRLAGLDLDVYESPTVWPRAFFTGTLRTYEGPEDFIRQVLNGDRRPFVAVQQSDLRRIPDGVRQLPTTLADRIVSPARDYAFTANTTSFTISATQPGIVVLAEAYYRADFQVTINDEPASYFRVNHAFKGVYLPHAGTYRVAFRYWPEQLTLGLWLCLAGVLLAIAIASLDRGKFAGRSATFAKD